MDLTDEQWEVLEPLIPDPARRPDGRDRPRRDSRDVLNGILWVLRTGAPWRDLPERYPPYQTCHRRFQRWNEEGVLDEIFRALVKDLRENGGLDLSECFIDGACVSAKKGADRWERPNGARARSSWRWQTLLDFFSAYTRRALRHTRSHSWRRR